MRDETSVNAEAGKRNVCRAFLRSVAIAVAVAGFLTEGAGAQAQSVDTIVAATLQPADRAGTAKRVAERIDDLALHPATRADIETLRELVDALKDELDAANVRIDHLQERLDAASAVERALPQAVPNTNAGAPLDPLSAVFASASAVAARLWGTTATTMATALAGLDHSFVASGVDSASLASLDPQAAGEAAGGVTAALFGRDTVAIAFNGLALRPWISGYRAPIVVARTVRPPSTKTADARRTTDASVLVATASVAPPAAQAKHPGVVRRSIEPARPAATVALHTGALLAAVQTNAQFDRALRAAGESPSFGASGEPGIVYPIFDTADRPALGQVTAALRSYAPIARTAAGTVTVPLKLGRARVTTRTSLQHVEQASTGADGLQLPSAEISQSRLHYDAAAVDTSFVVPAFHKSVTISVRGGYDRLHSPDTSTLPYYPTEASATNYELPSGGAPNADASVGADAPNHGDIERYTYGASAAVPVSHTMKVGVGYSSQHLSGTYGVSTGVPADRKDAYAGSLTYAPHDGKSSVTIAGREYRYSDDASPNSGFKETRGDVLFSMKF